MLREKQQDAAAFLARGIKKPKVAELVGVKEVTLAKWLQLDEMRQEVRARQFERVEGLVGKATQRIERLLDDPETPAAVVLAACKEVFDRAGFVPREAVERPSFSISLNLNAEAVPVQAPSRGRLLEHGQPETEHPTLPGLPEQASPPDPAEGAT